LDDPYRRISFDIVVRYRDISFCECDPSFFGRHERMRREVLDAGRLLRIDGSLQANTNRRSGREVDGDTRGELR